MSNLYVACELGAENGRIMLGALQKEGLTVSEAGEIKESTTCLEEVEEWNVPRIYQQVLVAARSIAAQGEVIRGLSFHSAVPDCLLFENNGSLIAPGTRLTEADGAAELDNVLSKITREVLYEQTGLQPSPAGMLCQLGTESARRLKRASHALPLADGLNFLFCGAPRIELSQAHQTQLYNPVTKSWSEGLLKASGVAERLLAPVVQAGAVLGQVRSEVAREGGLEDARVVATCSHSLAASLAALAIADQGSWAFLKPDASTLLGTRLETPFINEVSREMGYSNLLGYQQSVGLCKSWVGLRLVEECRRTWSAQDRAMDNDVLMHLATSATPFEAFIDPTDPRFASATDLPQEIQTYCRDTGQEAPRKPGSTLRCVLESLALHYRKGLLELEYITGNSLSRLYVLGDKSNTLLNHFLANALQIPVVVVRTDTAAVGNVVVQALALGHILSLDQARELVQGSLKMHTINPHASAWTEAYDRFLSLSPS